MTIKSLLKDKLSSGVFITTTQFAPSPNMPLNQIREEAKQLKNFTAVFAGEENRTEINLSSFSTALILKEEGIEPILQINSRDKNRIAIQKEIISASVSGINNMHVIAGIHPTSDNLKGSKVVYDLDPINIVSLIRNLIEKGEMLDSGEIGVKPEISIGIDDNPLEKPVEAKPMFLSKKIRAGADFIKTPPIFDVEKFSKFVDLFKTKYPETKLCLIASVYSLHSFDEAMNLPTFYRGSYVTSDILKQMEKSSTQENTGKEICIEIINKLKSFDCVKGVNILAQGRIDTVIEIANQI